MSLKSPNKPLKYTFKLCIPGPKEENVVRWESGGYASQEEAYRAVRETHLYTVIKFIFEYGGESFNGSLKKAYEKDDLDAVRIVEHVKEWLVRGYTWDMYMPSHHNPVTTNEDGSIPLYFCCELSDPK